MLQKIINRVNKKAALKAAFLYFINSKLNLVGLFVKA